MRMRMRKKSEGEKKKGKGKTKIKEFLMVPIISTSIILGCTSVQHLPLQTQTQSEKIKIHNIKNAISFVRNGNDKKMLEKASLIVNIYGTNIHYFKEFSQASPNSLKVKRNINVYDSFSLVVRATQDNFIHVYDNSTNIEGYVTLYDEHNNFTYGYKQKENISFISTSLGEIMIKVYTPESDEEIKFFHNKIISESVISFLYSTNHLSKEESENIINSIWNYNN